jgi:hypothetical protein
MTKRLPDVILVIVERDVGQRRLVWHHLPSFASSSSAGETLLHGGIAGNSLALLALDELGYPLVNLMAAVFLDLGSESFIEYSQVNVSKSETHLQVALNVTKQRDVEDRRCDEPDEADGEDDDGEDHSAKEHECDVVSVVVGREVVSLKVLNLGEREEEDGVDDLARGVGEEDILPAWKGKFAHQLCFVRAEEEAKDVPLKAKKTKKAKSSIFLVELAMWPKKQKCGYEPGRRWASDIGQQQRERKSTDEASSNCWP